MGSSGEPGTVLNALEHDGAEFTAIILQIPMRRIGGGDDVWFRGRVFTVQDIHEDRVVLSDREGFLAVGHAMWWELRVASLREALKN
jgi:hypothetical protein